MTFEKLYVPVPDNQKVRISAMMIFSQLHRKGKDKNFFFDELIHF